MGAECVNSVAGSVLSGEMSNMAETQGDIYVRKDVFDARMDRMELLLEKTVIEIKSYVDKSTGETKAYVEKAVGEIKAEIGEVRNDIRVLTARVDSLEHVVYWGIGGFGIILASAVLLPAITGVIKKIFRPSVTLEDVKRVAKEITETTAGEIAERVANAVIERHLSGGK